MTADRQRIAYASAAVVVAVAGVLLAFRVPVEYTPNGGRTLEGWWVAVAGLPAAVALASWPTAFRRAGLLVALFVLSSAAQLGLTYPHWAMSLRVAPDLLERPEHYLSLGILTVQGVAVFALARPQLVSALRFVLSVLSPLRAAALATVFVATAANVAAYYPQLFRSTYAMELYARWLVLAFVIAVLNLLLLWRIAVALPQDALAAMAERVRAWISLPGDSGPPKPFDEKLPWVGAIFVLAITGFFARVVLDGTAQFGDEVVYQFMADVYASGRLGVPAPPVPDAFEMYLVEVRDGMRYGVFVAGWPLVLAIGSFFGVPWLVNPVFGALSVPTAHALARRLTDRGTAHLLIVLMVTSPWFLVLSSVYQPHAVTLFAALLAWLGVDRAKADGSIGWALAAGLAAGVAFSVRPLDGLVIGGSAGLYAVSSLGGSRASWRAVAVYGAGCVATGSVSLWMNYQLTGSPLTYAMNVYFDREWGVGANRLGFGSDVGQLWGALDPIPGHGWRDVLFNTNLNLFTLNYDLLGWGIGSLFLFTVHLVWGRKEVFDWLWLAFIVGAIATYSLYWFNGGPDYGPRYWYSLLFPLLFLTTRGLATVVLMLRDRADVLDTARRAGYLVAVLAFVSLGVYAPWRAVSKYVDYRSKTPLFADALAAGAFGTNGLVIVDADGEGEYAALELNDLVPGEHGPIFARDLGNESVAALMEAFPGRPVYRAELRITPQGKRLTVTPLPQPSEGYR